MHRYGNMRAGAHTAPKASAASPASCDDENMLAKLPTWCARHFVPAVIVFLLLLLSHWDRLYLYGDDINNFGPGRQFPLPEYGHYIGGRMVDSFFHGFFVESFLRYFAPLFGLEHIIDAHSAFATLLFAVSSLGALAALYAFMRLVVDLRPAHFVTFSLCAYVYMLGRFEQDGATGLAAYSVPLALSLGLLYPTIRLAVFGSDAFTARSTHSTVIGMGLLTYLVGFSVTNIELFTLGVQLLCAVVLTVERTGVPLMRALRPRALWGSFCTLPPWFRVVTCLLPVTVAAAMFFDLNSGRFQDERLRVFRTEGFDSLSILDGLRSLPLSGGPNLDTIALVSTLGGMLLLLRGMRNSAAQVAGRPLARLAKLGFVLLPTCAAYWLFLVRISNVGGKDYFLNPGFNAYLMIIVMMPMLTALFALTRATRPGLVGTFLVAVVALHGMTRLNQVPVRAVSKAEVKSMFDSLFMCYCYGEERVPVFLRSSTTLGWPYGASEEGWYLETHRAVFREQVIGYGGFYDPEYRPRMVRVATVNELYAELDQMRNTKPLLYPGLRESPYFIDTSYPPRKSD